MTLRDAHADTLVFALARPLDDRNELLREFSVERAWYDALASSAADWRARFPEAFDRPTVDFRSWFARSVSNV